MRGSIPSPGAHTRKYGGNTPCVEIRFGDQLLIFDLGSGVRALGETLADVPVTASIFLSHYHYDHLQGLPFFAPIFNPKNHFTFHGPERDGQTVEQILAGQMVPPYFPVRTDVFRAQLAYRTVRSGEVMKIGEGKVSALDMNHPGGNLGYRVDLKGKSVVYATDIEHGSAKDEAFYNFARGADLLIYDAMYTEDEYLGRRGPAKTGWGHSTWQAAVQAADAAEIKRLVLFHHDPMRSDAELEKILRAVRRHRPDAIAARESLVLRA